jgi:hypothetical protein
MNTKNLTINPTRLDSFPIEQIRLFQTALGVYLDYREQVERQAEQTSRLMAERADLVAELACLQSSLPLPSLNGSHK